MGKADRSFLKGVIEGFYGRPWSQQQRLELLGLMQELELNTYLYCPKDDLKHRALWRECYTSDELQGLRELSWRVGIAASSFFMESPLV